MAVLRSSRRPRWDLRLVFVGMLLVSVAPAAVSAQVAAGEYELKAAFLHNFARFITWPPDRLRDGEPIVIAVVGADPFGRTIEVINGKMAGGHPVVVRHLRWNDDLAGTHILFISASELSRLATILESVQGRGVLTVGDFDRFAARGGMVELRMRNGRVQVDVNLAAATTADLKVSSKLLRVARVVSGGSEVK